MPTLDQIGTSMRGVVRSLLEMQADSVRPANQSAPTGTAQFATVNITSIRTEGWDSRGLENQAEPSVNVTETVQGLRRVVASVQFFRGDAMEKASKLRTLIGMSATADMLRQAGLGFAKASDVRNLTFVVDTQWEPRAQIDLEFYVVAGESGSLPTYTSFPITAPEFSSEVTAP